MPPRTTKKRSKRSESKRRIRHSSNTLIVDSLSKIPGMNKLVGSKKSNVVTFYLIYADWCGACHKFRKNIWDPALSRPGIHNRVAIRDDIFNNMDLSKKVRDLKYLPSLIVVDEKGEVQEFETPEGATNVMPTPKSVEDLLQAVNANVIPSPLPSMTLSSVPALVANANKSAVVANNAANAVVSAQQALINARAAANNARRSSNTIRQAVANVQMAANNAKKAANNAKAAAEMIMNKLGKMNSPSNEAAIAAAAAAAAAEVAEEAVENANANNNANVNANAYNMNMNANAYNNANVNANTYNNANVNANTYNNANVNANTYNNSYNNANAYNNSYNNANVNANANSYNANGFNANANGFNANTNYILNANNENANFSNNAEGNRRNANMEEIYTPPSNIRKLAPYYPTPETAPRLSGGSLLSMLSSYNRRNNARL